MRLTRSASEAGEAPAAAEAPRPDGRDPRTPETLGLFYDGYPEASGDEPVFGAEVASRAFVAVRGYTAGTYNVRVDYTTP